MPTLSRYTSIPSMLDTLLRRHLALLEPKTWSDLNDREVMETFAKSHPGKRVFAACMAEGKETAHHWQVFADRGLGACIRFDRERLAAASNLPHICQGPVSYVEWRELSRTTDASDRLPFIKRGVFRFEREYRVVALVDEGTAAISIGVPIPLDAITSVYLSGELPKSLFDTVVTLIRHIPGCGRLRVRHSGLLRNENWSRSLAGLAGDPR